MYRTLDPVYDSVPTLHQKFEAKILGNLTKNKAVLDIGCWTGQFLSLMGKASKRVGLDPEEAAIQYAKKYRKGTFLVGTALDLPFKNEKFDVVTMWDVIEHIPKDTEALAIREVARVLKNGGIFTLSTLTTHPLSILFDPAYFLIGHRHYSEKALRKFLKNERFRIKKVIYTGSGWVLIRDNLYLIFKHVFKKSLYIPLLERLVEKDYDKKGFHQIYIIATKN